MNSNAQSGLTREFPQSINPAQAEFDRLIRQSIIRAAAGQLAAKREQYAEHHVVERSPQKGAPS